MKKFFFTLVVILITAQPVLALERPIILIEPIDVPLEMPVVEPEPIVVPPGPVLEPVVMPPVEVAPEVPLPPKSDQPKPLPPASTLAVQAAGLNPAVAYLLAHGASSPEWAAMALVAAGQNASGLPVSSTTGVAIDVTRKILGLLAVGRDASALVSELEGLVVNGHLGTNTLINDDIFGVLALCAAGRLPESQPLSSLVSYVAANQRADGGWGTTTSSASDVDDTAAAIQSLHCVGGQGNSVSRGLAYMRSQQQADAGFPFRKPAASNSASTAWALHALDAVGASLNDWKVDGVSPRDVLLAFQNSDGGFRWQAAESQSTVLLTSYAVIALADRHLPVVKISIAPPPQPPPPPPVPDPAPPPSPTPPPEVPVVVEPPSAPDSSTVEQPEFSPAPNVANVQPQPQVLGAEITLPVAGVGGFDEVIFLLGFILVVAGTAGLRKYRKKSTIFFGKEQL